MKILPVSNSFNLQKNPKRNNANFNGLWGRTTYKTDFDAGLSVPKTETIYYYFPFQDETQDYINSVIAENSSAEIVDGRKYVVKDCRQCYTLPFDKKDYDTYLTIGYREDLTKKLVDIHRNVKDKYKNKDYSAKQESAVNPKVSRRLPQYN